MTLVTLFEIFEKNYYNYKVWQTEKTTRIEESLIKTVAESYYKVRQALQSETEFITKCDRRLLQSVTGITNSDNY